MDWKFLDNKTRNVLWSSQFSVAYVELANLFIPYPDIILNRKNAHDNVWINVVKLIANMTHTLVLQYVENTWVGDRIIGMRKIQQYVQIILINMHVKGVQMRVLYGLWRELFGSAGLLENDFIILLKYVF